ncbi:glycosyltransferase family 4 protein [Pseudoflavitalea sp. G-6-1-2]|uniref:glycosyltransferase n=1 Tax=Pseudoflavitalea sp. G-6-1-2 TaxID=2728841 RepID=UPI00146AD870|nr:glycosyltransferase family 4 protein [Pseudoflavitalea sp. G-6-1-2]
MKLALLTDGLFPLVVGGMQRHSTHLLKYLSLEGVSTTVYHVNPYAKRVSELGLSADQLTNIEFVEIKQPAAYKFPGHYVYEQYLYSKKLYQEFEKRKVPEILYAQGFSAWYLLNRKNSLPPGTKLILNFHGLEMFQQAATFRSKLEQYLLRPFVKGNLRRADFVITNGGIQTEILRKIGIREEQLIVAPIAIEKNWLRQSPLPENTIRKFLFVGRYERRRGIEELHKALASLLTKRNDFEFHFVCPVPEQIRILNNNNIIYHGRVSDEELMHLMTTCDVLVNPSFAEGMSYVNLEAMASGMSIIASNVGAIAMSVNQKNGWLIEPGNIVQLERTLDEALDLPASGLKEKKLRAFETVRDHFIWDKVIQNLIKELNTFHEKNNQEHPQET